MKNSRNSGYNCLVQKLSSLIISLYIAMFLFANLSFIKTFSIFKETGQLFWNNLAIFIILLIPIYFLINKYISVPCARSRSQSVMKIIRTVLLFLALLGLILTIFYHIIPLEPIYNLPAQLDQFFAPDTAFTIWLIVPLAVLFI